MKNIDILKHECCLVSSYPKAIALVSSGKIDPDLLITHKFALEESEKAFQTAYNPNSGAVKVIIQCNQG